MSLMNLPAASVSLAEVGKASLPVAIAEASTGLWVANNRVQMLLQVHRDSRVTALPRSQWTTNLCTSGKGGWCAGRQQLFPGIECSSPAMRLFLAPPGAIKCLVHTAGNRFNCLEICFCLQSCFCPLTRNLHCQNAFHKAGSPKVC